MHKLFHHKAIKLSTALLTTLFLFSGCENAQRDLDSMLHSGEVTAPDLNDTIMLPPSGGGVTDENSTVGEIKIDAKNAYRVAVTFSDNYAQKGYFSRGEIGQLHFDITNLYTGAPADVKNIDNITLEAAETVNTNGEQRGKYFNFITYSGEEGPIYKIPGASIKASDNVALKIGELSGTTELIFKAEIRLKEGTLSTYTLKVPLIIEKNRSSSMAIVPVETKYDNGLFTDKFVIHVVDSYGNKAEDGTHIYTGLINNPKLYTYALKENTDVDEDVLYDIISEHNRTYFNNDKGTLNRVAGTFTLPANSIDPQKDIVTNLDTLVILANKDEHKPENLGGWDIDSIDNDHEISLTSIHGSENISGVDYVIGDEYRYDECSQTVMNAAASSLETTEVENGLAYAELRYVPEMVGKTVFIYANAVINGKRIGISRKVTLKGLGLQSQSMSCDYKVTGPNCSMRWKMMLNGPQNQTAKNVYIEQPKLGGDPVYAYATASKIDCDGWTTVSIHGIDVNKTATVTFGNFIADELIQNQK